MPHDPSFEPFRRFYREGGFVSVPEAAAPSDLLRRLEALYGSQNLAEGGNVRDLMTGYSGQFYADGGDFDPEGSDYDYLSAISAGLGPQPVEDDDVPHWPSRVPETGMLLKGRDHPSFDTGVNKDRRLGYGLNMRDGRYYTEPFDEGVIETIAALNRLRGMK